MTPPAPPQPLGPAKAVAPPVYIGPSGTRPASRHAVLSGRANAFECEGETGSWSIKLVAAGSATWRTADGDSVVLDDSYLILDAGQRYAVTIDSPRAVETFTVWFRPGFVEEALRVATVPTERLLDDPEVAGAPPEPVFARLHRQDDAIGQALLDLRAGIAGRRLSNEAVEDRFYRIAAQLGELRRGALDAAMRLSAARPSTRAELLRRLLRGRDFAASSFRSAVTTDDMARAACLSTHHFHRLFSEAFDETPHQFLAARRLDRARRLLAHTDWSIGNICGEVGLASQGSFSTAFRKSYGVSPRQYRAARAAK